MSLALLSGLFLLLLGLGYHFYGQFIAFRFALNPKAVTPAHQFEDGVDFVPTKKFYLLGQHFSAIAAAGPIAGPILACQQFGWLPCLLWIGLGVIFIGSVHDFAALVASVRHKGDSIAGLIRETIGPRAWLAIMVFIWISLIYVIVAFTDITAGTFVGRIEELEGMNVAFERGGAVACASLLYMLLSIVMGVVQRLWNPRLWILTVIFVPATLFTVWASTYLSHWLLFSKETWISIILIYCLIASLLPVWLLLQPRGYLGGFILYMALAVGTIGVFLGNYEIHQEAFKTWDAGGINGSLFPFLFVTIACGACSGFHGLVCSGTTSKQIENEKDCKEVGYGAMLLEGFVAVIALATIMILTDTEAKGSPGTIYGAGIGRFLTLLIGEENLVFAITFGAMAFSTFVFDTLDVATRLGRYILQELTRSQGWVSSFLATLATVGVPAFFLLSGSEGGWSRFWILFGTSNQLLAALTLMGVSLWLQRIGKPFWFTLIPMFFILAITFTSLLYQIRAFFLTTGDAVNSVVILNGIVAALLMGLAVFLLLDGFLSYRKQVNAVS